MKYRIFICLSLICALNGAALGQAKVGTTITRFLSLSSSVRANGMGEAGVALIDNYSVYFNPASLGLLHQESHVQLTLYPIPADFGVGKINHWYYSSSGRFLHGYLGDEIPLIVNASYFITRLTSDPIPLTTHGNPEGTGEFFKFSDMAHDLALGMGILSPVNISAGTNLKYIRERYDNIKMDGIAFDFGLMVEVPFGKSVFSSMEHDDIRPYFSPSVGISWSNIGRDLEFAGQDVPLPKARRFGFSAPIGLAYKIKGEHLTIIKIVPAFETIKFRESPSETRYGGEINLIEAVSLRQGHLEESGVEYDTWGLGLKSRGIVKIFTDLLSPNSVVQYGSATQFFREKLQIQFEYAQQKFTFLDLYPKEIDYYGISLSL